MREPIGTRRLLARRLLGSRLAVASLAVAIAAVGCDRNVAPYDPDEEPRTPDLSKIFPEGADRAARVEPELPAAPSGRGAPPLAAEGGAPISGRVRLADDLGAAPPAGAVLFIIARRGDSGPPLAVKRVADPSLPLDFTIGPEDRMIQAMPFTGPLQLSARMDADGNAMSRAPGDLEGRVQAAVSPGDRGVDLVLDEVL